MSKISSKDGKVHFEYDAGSSVLSFDGHLLNDTIKGKFSQGEFTSTFILSLDNVKEQDAKLLPYHEFQVEFFNQDVKLSGTLSIPKKGEKFAAVMLISGSGAQTRESEIYGFKMFDTLSHYLTSNGIAVLRYEDRGVGESSGDLFDATTFDFANDAAAGIDFLKTYPHIDNARIGIIGHSEGGIISTILASKRNDLAFIVQMAGTALPGDEISLAQTKAIAEANNEPAEQIARAYNMNKMLYNSVKSDIPWTEVELELNKYIDEDISKLDKSQTQGAETSQIKKQMLTQIKNSIGSAWFREFVKYDPAPDLEKISCPVLALFGEKDLQVLAEPNKSAMIKSFKKGGKENFKIITIKDANHLFQAANTGLPAEYFSLEHEFVDGFLEDIIDWILTTTKHVNNLDD